MEGEAARPCPVLSAHLTGGTWAGEGRLCSCGAHARAPSKGGRLSPACARGWGHTCRPAAGEGGRCRLADRLQQAAFLPALPALSARPWRGRLAAGGGEEDRCPAAECESRLPGALAALAAERACGRRRRRSCAGWRQRRRRRAWTPCGASRRGRSAGAPLLGGMQRCVLLCVAGLRQAQAGAGGLPMRQCWPACCTPVMLCSPWDRAARPGEGGRRATTAHSMSTSCKGPCKRSCWRRAAPAMSCCERASDSVHGCCKGLAAPHRVLPPDRPATWCRAELKKQGLLLTGKAKKEADRLAAVREAMLKAAGPALPGTLPL